jgi:hypothetical protein
MLFLVSIIMHYELMSEKERKVLMNWLLLF